MTFVASLAAKGLLHEDMENIWDCCVVGNISENIWQLHAQALVLLVLPQKSNMLPDLSTSGGNCEYGRQVRMEIGHVGTEGVAVTPQHCGYAQAYFKVLSRQT